MGLISRLRLLAKGKASAALDRIEDPREILEYGFQQQQELLVKVKRGLVEVAASKARLEQQARRARESVPRLEDQALRAMEAGREDLARAVLQRKHAALAELDALEGQVAEVDREKERLSEAQRQLAAHIDEFRSRKIVLTARYSAAQARVRVSESLGGISGDMAELGLALGRAEEKTERLQARASALDALIDAEALVSPLSIDDPGGRELRQLLSAQAAEAELEALRLQIGPPRSDRSPADSEDR
jgi:phage shock protein A